MNKIISDEGLNSDKKRRVGKVGVKKCFEGDQPVMAKKAESSMFNQFY